jgi:hypothetical protein
MVVTGGLDATYLFDARPLEMTAAGLQHNYLGTEPTEWMGLNGARTLAASTTDVLRPFASDISVINGVIMSTSFDGHDQNMNILFSGNPFGGYSFLSQLGGGVPLDYVRFGDIKGAQLSDNRFVPISPNGAYELTGRLQTREGGATPLSHFVESRYEAAGAGPGRFSTGSRLLLESSRASGDLEEKLRQVALDRPSPPPQDGSLDLAGSLAVLAEYFRRGIVRSAVVNVTGPPTVNFDTHDATNARRQPAVYRQLLERIAQVLDYLKSTPFDDQRSLLDVTTVMLASEFGRTMRQNAPIDATGTDHNPLASSILLAGKGIKAGCVFGGTDFHTSDEELSGAHLGLDDKRMKVMGRPIDFGTGMPTEAMPDAFDPSLHLTIGSVVNTLYSMFGVDPAQHWLLGRNLPAAPIVPALLR